MRTIAILVLSWLAVGAETAEMLRLPAIADTSIVLYEGEESERHGAHPRIRIKGNQHIVAMAFDVSALAGRMVTSAELVCRRVDADIAAVSIGTISAPWNEAAANSLTAGIDGVAGWGVAGVSFPAVSLGNGGTMVCQAPSVVVDGWYRWRVDPALIDSLVIRTAYGLAIHEVDADYGRNPTIAAREQKADAPYLSVTCADAPVQPAPAPVADCTLDVRDPEQAWLSVRAPPGAVAYAVRVGEHDLPRWNIPIARPGEAQLIAIRDVPLPPGDVEASVVAIDRFGRRSPTAVARGTIIAAVEPVPTSDTALSSAATRSDLAVIPLMDRYDAAGGGVGALPEHHRVCNEVFDGATITLDAAKGEVVGFQVLATGSGEATATVAVPGCRVDLFRALYVDTPSGRIPDPLVPCAPFALSKTEATPIVAEVFVPFDAPAGVVRGSFALSDGRSLPIVLRVRDFALPKRASFLCEMNGYGLPDRVETFYRLQQTAYDHRVHANILHYSHRTAAPGARKCNLDMLLPPGRRMDEARYNDIAPGATTAYWDDVIAAFGPYLSGSCFARGHRGAVPAPGFYLTFHESWPLNVRAFFNGDPDAFKAFDRPEYADTFVAVLRDFARVAAREGWTETGFQVYCNNKGSLADPQRAPWVLDEPSSWWDYRALAFYGGLVRRAKGDTCPIRLDYRIDISRPEFIRGTLDGVADLWVVGQGAYANHRRLVRDHARRHGERVWVYGSNNPLDRSNRDTQAWVLSAFRDGATGIVPWQTIVGAGALTKGDDLGIFILDGAGADVAVRHTLRLNAYCRAQQDVEYLCLLRDRLGMTPGQIARFIDHHLDLSVAHERTSEEDAGRARYAHASPDGFRRLRAATADLIESSVPKSR